MLGLYVSDHPLMGLERLIARKADCTVPASSTTCEDGTRRTVGGVVTALQRKWTKKGDLMAVFTLEDLQGSVEVMVFPKTMARHRPPAGGRRCRAPLGAGWTGATTPRSSSPWTSSSSSPLAEGSPPLRLHLQPSRLDDATVGRLKELFADFPGDIRGAHPPRRAAVLRLPDQFLVSTDSGLVGELRVLLGADAVVT